MISNHNLKCLSKKKPRLDKSYRELNLNLDDLMGVDFLNVPKEMRNMKTICSCKMVPLNQNQNQNHMNINHNIKMGNIEMGHNELKMDPEIEKLLTRMKSNQMPKHPILLNNTVTKKSFKSKKSKTRMKPKYKSKYKSQPRYRKKSNPSIKKSVKKIKKNTKKSQKTSKKTKKSSKTAIQKKIKKNQTLSRKELDDLAKKLIAESMG